MDVRQPTKAEIMPKQLGGSVARNAEHIKQRETQSKCKVRGLANMRWKMSTRRIRRSGSNSLKTSRSVQSLQIPNIDEQKYEAFIAISQKRNPVSIVSSFQDACINVSVILPLVVLFS